METIPPCFIFIKIIIHGIIIQFKGILKLEVSGMGFKDLPGGSSAKQGQSAADKTTAQQAPAASDTLQKQESLTNTKSSQ